MGGWDYDCWVSGEPASAKNQRRIVLLHGKPRIIKSKKALAYSRGFASQADRLDPLLEGDVALRIDAYYASRRPDLSCLDLIMDLLEGFAYKNDRQVKATQCYWNLDRESPRVRVRARSLPTDCSVGTSSSKLHTIWGPEQT